MNASIEIAQECTGKTTAGALLKVIKLGGIESLIASGRRLANCPSYASAWQFDVEATRREDGIEQTTSVRVPGWCGNGHTSKREESEYERWRYCETYAPMRGCWHLAHNETLRNVLALLPAATEIALFVSLDAGTNGYMVNADSTMKSDSGREWTEQGLHSDSLYLVAQVKRGSKTVEQRFLLDTCCGAHNSARFGDAR